LGSVDLHVPKQMALYNGDGTRFLKQSLTKNNKPAKQRNQPSIIFKTLIWLAKDLFLIANHGNVSKSNKNIKDVIKEYIWHVENREHGDIVPTMKFIKELKINGKKFYTKELEDEYKKETTQKDKMNFRKELILEYRDILFPQWDGYF
jgi:hypothetical protein